MGFSGLQWASVGWSPVRWFWIFRLSGTYLAPLTPQVRVGLIRVISFGDLQWALVIVSGLSPYWNLFFDLRPRYVHFFASPPVLMPSIVPGLTDCFLVDFSDYWGIGACCES